MNLLSAVPFALWCVRQKRVTTMTPEQVLAIQQCRLRGLLRRVGENSPFYRRKYQGLDPRRCRLTDLPPTTKGELNDNFDEVMTDREVSLRSLERFMANPDNARRR